FQKQQKDQTNEPQTSQTKKIEAQVPTTKLKRKDANIKEEDTSVSLDALQEAIKRGKSIMNLQAEKDEASLKLEIANLNKQLAVTQATAEMIKKNPEVIATKELGAKELPNTKITIPQNDKLPSLNAISGDKVIVSGRILKIGDKIEGYRIVSIGKNSIEVEKEGKTYTVELP
ncbi:MAG: hypothetical protein AB1488_08130, partial [Nitrospirota bacterium]